MTVKEWTCPIPELIPMSQTFENPVLEAPGLEAYSLVSTLLKKCNNIAPGSKIAIAVGSRGIGGIREIIAGVVDAVKDCQYNPFIVPAMGSHGGSDPVEKIRILSNLGITEDSIGAPISKSAEVKLLGQVEGDLQVFCHAQAFAAGSIILVNRVKPHTDFKGVIESGLVKMAAVGLGGIQGARSVHKGGPDHLAARVKKAGETAVRMDPIRLGLAIIEGPTGHPVHIETIFPKEISSREQVLLEEARKLVPKLPVNKLDVLAIAEMGKNISGAGVDPDVIGRCLTNEIVAHGDVPRIHRIAVLELTDASSGNAAGIGLCDVTTKKVYDKTNFRAMYENVITCKGSIAAKFPMVMDSDHEAICVALLTCIREPLEAHMALIRNTLNLDHFLVSKPLVPQCELAGAEVIGQPIKLIFDSNGSLIWPNCLRKQKTTS